MISFLCLKKKKTKEEKNSDKKDVWFELDLRCSDLTELSNKNAASSNVRVVRESRLV